MPEKTSLALIVPCYNEASSIPFFETELVKFQKEFSERYPGSDLSVIVVENNSTDESGSLLASLAGRHPYVKIEHCRIQGYGAALKHGFSAANGDYVAFLDLDNTYPMAELIEMFRLVLSHNLDIIYGARLHSKSEISFIRSLGNSFYVYLLRIFFNSPLSDVCSGMRIFRAGRKPEILGLSRNDLSFSIEFTALVLTRKWNVSEFKIPYRDRVGSSKLSIVKDGLLFLSVVLQKAISKDR